MHMTTYIVSFIEYSHMAIQCMKTALFYKHLGNDSFSLQILQYFIDFISTYIFDFGVSCTNFGNAVLICTRLTDLKSILHLKYCI